MAEAGAGAWQNGGGGHAIHHHHVAVTGIPNVIYNPPPVSASGTGKGAAIISVTLRLLTVVFTVVAFCVMASNQGTEWETYYEKGVGYFRDWTTKWRALNASDGIFILSANVIVCFYSLVQLLVSMVRACSGLQVLPGPTSAASTITFLFDQVMTYMMMGACGAGASMVMFSTTFAHSYDVGCDDGFRVFCDKYVGSVVMSFLAFACMALTVDLQYVYRVYKMATKRA